jgi:hypothetical protein
MALPIDIKESTDIEDSIDTSGSSWFSSSFDSLGSFFSDSFNGIVDSIMSIENPCAATSDESDLTLPTPELKARGIRKRV